MPCSRGTFGSGGMLCIHFDGSAGGSLQREWHKGGGDLVSMKGHNDQMQMFVGRQPKLALLDLKTVEAEASSAKRKWSRPVLSSGLCSNEHNHNLMPEVRRAQVKKFQRHYALLLSKKPRNQTNLGCLAATEPRRAQVGECLKHCAQLL